MIGVFDSGVGGLTFVKALWKILPQYRVVYFGDTARVPYGNKSPETIRRYAKEAVDFLQSKGAKLIVAACHTVSAVATEDIQKQLSVPFFDVLHSIKDNVLETSKTGRIGIIGTASTIRSNRHKEVLQKHFDGQKARYPYAKLEIFEVACPLFVPLIEEGFMKRPETVRIIRYYLRDLKKQYIDTLVLACTHYPLLRKQIQDVVGKRVKLIDPSEITAGIVKDYLDNHPEVQSRLPLDSKHQFYVSDDPEKFSRLTKIWLGLNVRAEQVSIEK